jgi:hypothetical protein
MNPEAQQRRGRPSLSPKQDMQGIDPVTGEAERPREIVHVDLIPDLPDVVSPDAPTPEAAARERAHNPTRLNVEETILNILREEFDELSVRLERFGVELSAPQKQELVDYSMAVLAGMVAGGTLSRR